MHPKLQALEHTSLAKAMCHQSVLQLCTQVRNVYAGILLLHAIAACFCQCMQQIQCIKHIVMAMLHA